MPEAEQNQWQEVWQYKYYKSNSWKDAELEDYQSYENYQSYSLSFGWEDITQRIYRKASAIQEEEETKPSNGEIDYVFEMIYNNVKPEYTNYHWVSVEKAKETPAYQVAVRCMVEYAQRYAATLLSAKDKEIAELHEQLEQAAKNKYLIQGALFDVIKCLTQECNKTSSGRKLLADILQYVESK